MREPNRNRGAWRLRSRWFAILVSTGFGLIAVLSTPPALAQSPPPSAPAFPDQPGKWVGTATVGGQLQSGRTSTRGLSFKAHFGYMNHWKQTFRIDLLSELAEFSAFDSGEDRQKVQDTRLAAITFMHPLTSRFSFVEVAQYQHDLTHELDHREMLSTGIAWHAIRGKRVELLIIPGVNLGRQRSDLENSPTSINAFGAYQLLSVSITPTFSFQESVTAFQDFDDSQFRALTLNSSASAKISKHLGLSVGYTYSYEGIRPEDAPTSQSTVSLGLMFSL